MPLWAVGLLVLLALLAAVECGRFLHRILSRSAGEAAAVPDQLLAAVLGLLALLLGFTFSLALSRHEARRDLVIQEANAIGTTWLRAQLLEEPQRGAMRGLLVAYVDSRLGWSEADDPAVGQARTADLQRRLWTVMGAAIRKDSAPLLSRGVMDAMNESFDLAAARSAARMARLPAQVVNVLLLYMLLSAAMLGYVLSGEGRAHRIATAQLMVLLVLAFSLILDLDRPRSGAIHVSQQPLEDLRASMR